MKIVIAGGDTKAEYIIKSFKDRKNELVVINPSLEIVERIKRSCYVKVYHGEPWSRITLEQVPPLSRVTDGSNPNTLSRADSI